MFSNLASTKNLSPQIDAVVLLDRSVDLLTPLSTQLTYEGLIDEVYGIKYGRYYVITQITQYKVIMGSRTNSVCEFTTMLEDSPVVSQDGCRMPS